MNCSGQCGCVVRSGQLCRGSVRHMEGCDWVEKGRLGVLINEREGVRGQAGVSGGW